MGNSLKEETHWNNISVKGARFLHTWSPGRVSRCRQLGQRRQTVVCPHFMMNSKEMTAELSGSQNLPTSWATSPMLGCEQDWGGRMCAAKRGRHLNMSFPLEGKQGFQGVRTSTSFKKTSSFLNWGEKLFLPGAMSPQIDYISESPGTLGETQIPKYQPGLTESESPFFLYSAPEEKRNLNSSRPKSFWWDDWQNSTLRPFVYRVTLKHSSVHSQRRAVISTLLSVGWTR